MIKIYCDKCGKEITDNVNREVEETKAVDLHGVVVAKWTDILHYCDECQYNELTCDFKVGDQVITSTGKVGTITSICTCDQCKDRGFYEPTVELEIGDGSIWITDNDKRVNFRSFYKIGDRVFGNIDEECVVNNIKSKKEFIKEQQEELIQLEGQLNVIKGLKKDN